MSQPATGQLTVPDVPLAAQDPDYGKWGFAQTPSLRELQHLNQAQQEQGHHDARSPGQDPDGWLASLHSSRVFACPGCIDAMGKALGLTEVLTALSGTLATPAATPSQAAAAVEVVHNAIDISWSGEALRRGVAAAKSGAYADALHCYDKALHLWPHNADALVARGAALANRKQYQAAIDDFQAALALRPGDTNASAYLQATHNHMAQDSGTAVGSHTRRPGDSTGVRQHHSSTTATPSSTAQQPPRASLTRGQVEPSSCKRAAADPAPDHKQRKRAHSSSPSSGGASSGSANSSSSDTSSSSYSQQHARRPAADPEGPGYTAADVKEVLARLGQDSTLIDPAPPARERADKRHKHKSKQKRHRKQRSKHKGGDRKSKKHKKHRSKR